MGGYFARPLFFLVMKFFKKIIGVFKPHKIVKILADLHKKSSLATKIQGVLFVVILSVLLSKGIITAEDFKNLIEILVK